MHANRSFLHTVDTHANNLAFFIGHVSGALSRTQTMNPTAEATPLLTSGKESLLLSVALFSPQGKISSC